jgi:stress-induced morphogen
MHSIPESERLTVSNPNPHHDDVVGSTPQPTNIQWIQWRLMAAFPQCILDIQDTRGDDQHLSVTISSTAFSGKSRIACHQMVYAALDHMRQGCIHAMSLKTIPA